MCSAGGAQGLPERVAPFGNPRLGLLDSSPTLADGTGRGGASQSCQLPDKLGLSDRRGLGGR